MKAVYMGMCVFISLYIYIYVCVKVISYIYVCVSLMVTDSDPVTLITLR